jgi:hypothetical protein
MEKGYHLHLTQDKKEYFSLPTGWAPLYFIETDEAAPKSSRPTTRGTEDCHHRG